MKNEWQEITRAGAKRSAAAMHILRTVFLAHPGPLAIRLWNGETVAIGTGAPAFTLVFHHPAPLRDLVMSQSPLKLAESYFRGLVDVEGDLYRALALKDQLASLRMQLHQRLMLAVKALTLIGWRSDSPDVRDGREHDRPLRGRIVGRHSKRENERAISFHYDVSNEFYRLWLDEQMVYSCGYFAHPQESLELAQRNKLEHICRKLRLKPGERLLDIGCGWGGLIIWAGKQYQIRAHGVTLSRKQYEYTVQRIRNEGLQDLVTVELRDYRELDGREAFDKIASVGMFEHVGLKNLPVYFRIVHRLLKPGGLFLNHGITSQEEGWKKTLSTNFINRYVFPDGELDTVSNVHTAMERSHFEILDVEALRPHYALTLRHWVSRLEHNREEALRHVDESTYRVWRLYMSACALAFEKGETGIYQILGAKRCDGVVNMPLTRQDIDR